MADGLNYELELGLAQAEKDVAAAEKSLSAARESLQKTDDTYTPVGKVYPRTSSGRRYCVRSSDRPVDAASSTNGPLRYDA